MNTYNKVLENNKTELRDNEVYIGCVKDGETWYKDHPDFFECY